MIAAAASLALLAVVWPRRPRWPRFPRRRRPRRDEIRAELLTFCRLVMLGLGAGATFPIAVRVAAAEAPGAVAADALGALRRSAPAGIAALAGDEGTARPLFVAVGKATVSGSPILPAVAALVATLHDETRVAALERARRLPVKLLFPLALLILPGFLAMTLGPAVVVGIHRLSL